ncbi:methylated-DNA--[protein]-cysteine S-methyltransferase [Stieleria sp. TO1_6]|nr:methylated-DNA--[protein]-cysteine S-methyltransferase [Stieleria tagensis]
MITNNPSTVRRMTHSTPLGSMVSVWTDAGLYSLSFDSVAFAEPPTDMPTDVPAGAMADDVGDDRLEDLLQEYFQSGTADFQSLRLDTRGWTPFTSKIYHACRQIPSGSTLTYKQLGSRAGSPSASRAVGAAMARNRVLLVIPCHRVLSSGGALRGFSAPGGLQTKQYLLDLEAR